MNLFEYLSKTIMTAFYGIMLILDGLVYSLVAFLYKIFQVLASAEIFSSDIYVEIANRIQVVVGVAMLFIMAYALLRAVINPDDLDSKTGISVKSIVPSFVKTVILIALVPTLFTYAYKAQNVILLGNVLGKIIIGDEEAKKYAKDYTYTTQSGQKITKNLSTEEVQRAYVELGGTRMAQQVFETFFYVNDGYKDDDTKVDEKTAKEMGFGKKVLLWASCLTAIGTVVTGLWIPALIAGLACVAGFWQSITGALEISLGQANTMVAATGEFDVYVIFVDRIADGIIHYSWFLSTLCGIFVCYILISFCIDLGLRAVKLGYYQMIAPVPIFANMLPKGKDIFDKWVKSVSSTFFGVFIRVMVIFLIVFLIGKLPDMADMFKNSTVTATSTAVKLFARLFIILGLLMFAKQAPKLISEMFGISDGSLKLGIKDKLTEANVFRAGAAIGSGVTAGVRNFTATKGQGIGKRISSTAGGLASGTVRGAKSGKDAKGWSDMKTAAGKGAKETTDKREKRAAYRAEHGDSGLGVLGGRIEDFIDSVPRWAGGGDAAKVERLKKEIGINDQVAKSRTDLFDLAEKYSNPGKNNIKLNLDSADIAKKYFESTTRGLSDVDRDAKLKEILGDSYQNITLGTLEQIAKSGKTADGKTELSAAQKTGLDSLLQAQSGYVKSGVVSGTIGKDEDGHWVNTEVDIGKTVVYDPNLTASLQNLQKELINAYRTLGKDNAMFQGQENAVLRSIADGTLKLANFNNGGTITVVDAKGKTETIDLGKMTGKKYMTDPLGSSKSTLNIELSEILTRIEEAQNSDKK